MEYQITLTQQSLQVINDALMQMPYYLASPVVDEINAQILERNTMNKDSINDDQRK